MEGLWEGWEEEGNIGTNFLGSVINMRKNKFAFLLFLLGGTLLLFPGFNGDQWNQVSQYKLT